ncbi:heme peroxidase [Cladochytrium replicatum]|nr:heme peroxidase [Cladochytrium replicatum]
MQAKGKRQLDQSVSIRYRVPDSVIQCQNFYCALSPLLPYFNRSSFTPPSCRVVSMQARSLYVVFLLLVASFAIYANAAYNVTIDEVLETSKNLVSFIEIEKGCMISEVHMKPTNPSQNLAALWIRALFHDAGTYQPNDTAHPGGMDGSLLTYAGMKEHLGLQNSLATLFLLGRTTLSDPDVLALAGLATIKHCGGPSILFEAGRVKAAEPVNPTGRMPEDTDSYAHIKSRMTAMGFTPQEMVLLISGSHTMGGTHVGISPHLTNSSFVPFDSTPGVFDNDIFKQLVAGRCQTRIDCFLSQDPTLKPFYEKYANDSIAFFDDYTAAMLKMLRLPPRPLNAVIDSDGHVHLEVPVHTNLVAEGTVNVSSLPPVRTSVPGESSATSLRALNGLIIAMISVLLLVFATV